MARRWFKIGSGVAIGVTTIVGLFLLLINLYNFQINGTDDYCSGTVEDPCISYITVRNPNMYDVDIYNQNDISLGFSPEIKKYYLFREDGRCTGKIGSSCCAPDGLTCFKGYNFINFTEKTKPVATKEYVFRFPAKETKKFLLYGLKNKPTDRIKWTFTTDKGTLDPVWYDTYSSNPSGTFEDTTWDSTNKDIRLLSDAFFIFNDNTMYNITRQPLSNFSELSVNNFIPTSSGYHLSDINDGRKAWTDGCLFENCLRFDGQTMFARMNPSTLSTIENSSFSGCIWAKTRGNGFLFSKEGTTNPRFWINLSQGKINFYANDNVVTSITISSNDTINNNVWHQACFVFSRETEMASLYIDGRLNQTISISDFGLMSSTNEVTFGKRSDNTNYYDSMLTGFKFWNASLTADNISVLYTREATGLITSNVTVNLTIDLVFNETMGADVFDKSGVGRQCNVTAQRPVFKQSGGHDGKGGYNFNSQNKNRIIFGSTDTFNWVPQTANFTILAWFNTSDVTTAGISFGIIGNVASATDVGFSLSHQLTNLWFYLGNGTKLSSNSLIANLVAGKMNCVVVQGNKSNLFWNLNGQNYENDTLYQEQFAGTISVSTKVMAIGSMHSTYGAYINGTVDNVMIWNYTLSKEMVFNLCNDSGRYYNSSDFIPKYKSNGNYTGTINLSSQSRIDNLTLSNLIGNSTSLRRKDNSDVRILSLWTGDDNSDDLGYNTPTRTSGQQLNTGINGSWFFDGVDDFVSLANHTLTVGKPFTICGWLAGFENGSTPSQYAFYGTTGSGADYTYFRLFSDTQISASIANGSTNKGCVLTANVPSGYWRTKHFYCGNLNESNYSNIYYDGKLAGSLDCGNYSNRNGLVFGRLGNVAVNYFTGTMDEIYYINGSLSPLEVMELYRRSIPTKIELKSKVYDNITATWSSWYDNNQSNLQTGMFRINTSLPYGNNYSYKLTYTSGDLEFTSLINETILDGTEYPCDCPQTPSTWVVNMSKNCVLQSSCNITNYNLYTKYNGNFTVNSTLYLYNITSLISDQTIWMKPIGIIYMSNKR